MNLAFVGRRIGNLLTLATVIAGMACTGDDDAASFAPHGSKTRPRDAGSESDGATPTRPSGATGSPTEPNGGSGGSADDGADGSFSPDQVYLFGALAEVTCGDTAIANIATPDRGLVGFPCGSSIKAAQIDPSKKALLYIDTAVVREFHCDNGCSFWSEGDGYPDKPTADDPEIEHHCGGRLSSFRVSPEGYLVVGCDSAWFDESGGKLADDVLAVGHDQVMLGPHGVFGVGDTATKPALGLPLGEIIAVRVSDVGFRVALVNPDTTESELWEVDSSSHSATQLGSFPAPPKQETRVEKAGVLDSDYALYQIAHQNNVDTVVRRTIDGASGEAYTELGGRVVKINGSSLVTGP